MEAVHAHFDCPYIENRMGGVREDALRTAFDRGLKLEFHGTKVTSDAGLLAYRELEEALDLTTAIDSELPDKQTTGSKYAEEVAQSLIGGKLA